MIPEIVMQLLQAIALLVSIVVGIATLVKGGIYLTVQQKP